MTYHEPDTAKRLQLLIHLLNEEQREREAIARNFHSRLSDLAAVRLLLGQIEKKYSQDAPISADITQVKQILSGYNREARLISSAIFPAILKLVGLPKLLAQFVRETSENYDVEIEHTSLVEKPLELDPAKETGVYKTCTELIEYLVSTGAPKLMVHIKAGNELLEVEIASGQAQPLQQNLKLDLLKARLIWLEADIAPQTNWSTVFKFSIPVA